MREQHENGTASAISEAPRVEAGANGRGSLLCPYCGHVQVLGEQCERCRGLFEPLSRQATQNQMGPWQVRSEKQPFSPGFSYEKLREMIVKGRITRSTIVRGPSTRQFWSLACNAPGVAVLLGECHNCHSAVDTDEYLCRTCNAVLTCSTDRQYLGLGPVKLLPGDAAAHEVASSAMSRASDRPAVPMPLPAASKTEEMRPASAETPGETESLASRRRARREAETVRAMIAAAVVLSVIAVTVFAMIALKR